MVQPTHRSSRILLPVKQGFILLSLVMALLLDLMPLGRLPGVPDWVALVLAFWSVREPLRIGMTTAFLLGIVMDVADASLMGQHALAYVLVAYGASRLSRRILWFSLPQQALHILPLLLLMQLVILIVRLIAGAEFPGWSYFLSSVTAALLWTPLTFLLLLPQYQPVDKDENRPI